MGCLVQIILLNVFVVAALAVNRGTVAALLEQPDAPISIARFKALRAGMREEICAVTDQIVLANLLSPVAAACAPVFKSAGVCPPLCSIKLEKQVDIPRNLQSCMDAMKSGSFYDTNIMSASIFEFLAGAATLAKVCNIAPLSASLTPSSTQAAASPLPSSPILSSPLLSSPLPSPLPSPSPSSPPLDIFGGSVAEAVQPSPSQSPQATQGAAAAVKNTAQTPMPTIDTDLSAQEMGAPSPQASLAVDPSTSPSAAPVVIDPMAQPVEENMQPGVTPSQSVSATMSVLPTPSVSISPTGTPVMSISPGAMALESPSSSGTVLPPLAADTEGSAEATTASATPVALEPSASSTASPFTGTPSTSPVAKFYMTVNDAVAGNETIAGDDAAPLAMPDISLIDASGERAARIVEQTASDMIKEVAGLVSANYSISWNETDPSLRSPMLPANLSVDNTTNMLADYVLGQNSKRSEAYNHFVATAQGYQADIQASLAAAARVAEKAAAVLRALARRRRKLSIDALDAKARSVDASIEDVAKLLRGENVTVSIDKEHAINWLVNLVDPALLQAYDADAGLVVPNWQTQVQAAISQIKAGAQKLQGLLAAQKSAVRSDQVSDESAKLQLNSSLDTATTLLGQVAADMGYSAPEIPSNNTDEDAIPSWVLGALAPDRQQNETVLFDKYQSSQAERLNLRERLQAQIRDASTPMQHALQKYMTLQMDYSLPLSVVPALQADYDALVHGYSINRTDLEKAVDAATASFKETQSRRRDYIAGLSAEVNRTIAERTAYLQGLAPTATSLPPALPTMAASNESVANSSAATATVSPAASVVSGTNVSNDSVVPPALSASPAAATATASPSPLDVSPIGSTPIPSTTQQAPSPTGAALAPVGSSPIPANNMSFRDLFGEQLVLQPDT